MSTPLFKNAFRRDTRRTRGDFLKLVITLLPMIFILVGILAGAAEVAAIIVQVTQDPIVLAIIT